jgi:hypothetical protein
MNSPRVMTEESLNTIARRARLSKAAIVLASMLTVAALAAVLLTNGNAEHSEIKVESAIRELPASKVAR